MTIDNLDERQFYEIEAVANGWNVRELERQLACSLYERLSLSRDKEEIRRLSREGQVVGKAADLIKNPLVLEFLGLEEKPTHPENELETAIINRLESFLLELGKGFLFEARQKRFTFDNDHFFVDLVFYNRLLRPVSSPRNINYIYPPRMSCGRRWKKPKQNWKQDVSDERHMGALSVVCASIAGTRSRQVDIIGPNGSYATLWPIS
jgi:predicted nuclease of restriction endonuclease-like (RecB) superfamily